MTLKVLPYLQSIQLLTLFSPSFHSFFFLCVYMLSTQLCLILCNPVDYSMPGFPVLHYLPEFAQIHVRWVSDAI